MEVAILTTVLGRVLSTVLPELMKKALGIIKEPADLSSIQELIMEMNPIREEIRDYHRNRSKELSPEWRRKVKKLRHLAYNIQDCLDKVKIGKINTAEFAVEIRVLERSLRQHFTEMETYMRQGNPSRSGAQELPQDVPNHDGLVGIEEIQHDLLALVRNCVNPAPMVISIVVDSGGQDNSSLAAKFYDDSEVRKFFPLRIFAHATGKDKDDVLEEIFRKLQSINPGVDAQARPQGNERYFIVIDGVQEIELGCHVISWFRQAVEARGIIVVTTTTQSVAESCSSGLGPVFKSTNLPLDDLLKLVRNYANPLPLVISIVGFHGVGKSSLAAKVYDDLTVHNSFPLRVFVRATGKDKDDVLNEILRKLSSPQVDKRYFIVIDDVQEEALGCHVRNWFSKVTKPDGKPDGIILVTTTVQSVAKRCSSGYGHVYKMRQLDAAKSKRLFSDTHHRIHPPPNEAGQDNTKGIRKECDGIPLALISMAEFWDRTIPCNKAWRRLFEQDRSGEMCLVLERSYNSLPSIDAETCLHYFSLFPGGYPVKRGALLRRWMAEGEEVGCNSLVADNTPQALQNLKTLIDRNVIWPVQVSTNEEQDAMTCRPPRAMLGYMSDESKKEGFFVFPSEEDGSGTGQLIRRISLQTDGSAGILKNEGDVSRLRTLVVPPGEGSDVKAAALSFDNCGLLRVLDLQACHGPQKIDLNRKICKKLKLLKYLSLRADIVGYIPQEISQLRCLETLDVGKEKVAVLVHVDVIRLPCLKHLVGKFQLKETILSRVCTITGSNLETLAGFVTLEGRGFPRLMHHMSKLRKVKIFIDPNARATSFSDRLAKAIKAFLPTSAHPVDKDERRSLSIDLQESKNQEDVLGSLAEAQGTLHSFKLSSGHNLVRIPSFIGKWNGIMKLCLSFETIKWEAIRDGIGNLPHLKYLKLVAKVEFQGVSVGVIGQFRSVLLIQPSQFTKLEQMCLQSVGSLTKIEIEGEALNSLVSLHLICGVIGVPAEVICNDPTKQTRPANQGSSPHKIPPLKSLKEVALQSSDVDHEIKTAWHEAARGHPKRPQVMFV